MAAQNQNATQWLGDDGTITITVTDDSGNIVNISGVEAFYWVGKNAKAAGLDVYVKKEVGGGITLNGSAGQIVISLTGLDTETLQAGRFYHECRIKDLTGDWTTVTTGTLTIVQTMIPDSAGSSG